MRDTSLSNVAVFRSNFLPYSETFIHDELRHHVRYRATVFARTWRNQERFSGHNVVYIEKQPGKRNRIGYVRFKYFRRSRKFDHELRKRPYALIHAHFGYDGVYALPFANRHNLPLVVSLWGHDVSILAGEEKHLRKWSLYRRYYKDMERRASLFLCVSDDLKQTMIKIGCPPEKLVVHPQGIDLTRFRPNDETPDKFRVVMIGRFVEKKGFETGLEAFSKLPRACESELLMIGDGPLRDKYLALANEHGLNGKIHFVGNQPADAVAAILQTASVAMVPSLTASNGDKEGLPTVIKEAMASGVPVLATRHGGIPEIVSDNRDGFLVNEGDVKSLTAGLYTLLRNPELGRKMGYHGRLKMEKSHNAERLNEKLEDLYDEAVKRHSMGGAKSI